MQQARRNYLITKQLIVRLLFLLLACGSFTHPIQARLVGKIRRVKPVVEIRRGTTGAWKRAVRRTNIEPGHYIRSGPQGRAELSFTGGTRVTLNSKTQVFIEGDNTPAKPLGLRIFGAFSQIVVRNRGFMPIRAAAAIAAPRGTEYMVTLTDEDTMVLTVKEGSVRFYNAQGEQIVNANRQSTARPGQAPTTPVAVDASGLMQWAFDVSALPVEFEMGAVQGDLNILRPRAEANPNDAAAQRDLAGALLVSGDANSAVAAYQKAVQLGPVDASRVGLAIALLARDDLAAARNALSPNPESALELAARGLVQLRSNETDAALLSLKQATERDPRSSQALSLLTLTHLTRNEIAQALEAGRRAVQAAPHSSQAQAALSLALFYDGQSREATRAASRAVQLNPDSPLALLVHGQALLAGHQTDAARAALQQAEGLAPDLPIIQNNLAAAYLRLDMPQRAERAYRRVIAKTPNSAAAHAGLGSVLISMGQRAEGLAELQRALELDPESVPARAGMALYHIEMGDFAAAQRIATTIGDDPANGLLYIRLSEASLFQQKLFEAQEYARRAVKLLPDSAPAHYQLGRVYREQDRNVQAEQQFRQAVILDRNFAEARFAFGLARERAESSRNLSRPLNSVASNASGPSQALNIQNLQTPGFGDRIQAAIQDPSVIRSASRAFGDNQLDGRIGQDNTNNFALSHLQEINNRRGSFGAAISRDHTDGIRLNADLTNEKAGLIWGRKSADNPSGFFALAQWNRTKSGADTSLVPLGLSAPRGDREIPQLILGYNLQNSARKSTRFLLQADRPSNDVRSITGFSNIKGRSYHAEARHDIQVNPRNLFSIGAATGARRFNGLSFENRPDPDIITVNREYLKFGQIYLRNEWQAARKLTVMSELKTQILSIDQRSVLSPPIFTPPVVDKTTVRVLPNLTVDYRPNRRSGLRLNARRLFSPIKDFDLLSPREDFLLFPHGLPEIVLDGSGHSVELEYDYTFGSGAFFRLGAFQYDLNGTKNDSTGDFFSKIKFRGLSARYEGILSRSTTCFAETVLTDATGDVVIAAPLTNYRATRTPRLTFESGVQYLSKVGWFVQPSVAFIGSRLQENVGDGSPRQRLGSFALANLRIGKRNGLKSSLFIEISNLFDKQYIAPQGQFRGNLQPGRQIFVGATWRH